jgi:hypothetical protein
MIQHVTYHLSWDELGYTTLAEIMELIGFQEVEPNDPFEHGYRVRWFRNPQPGTAAVLIHFVADGAAQDLGLGLGHFCVTVGRERFEQCRKSDYLARDSGSGRIWLEYDNGRLRIEVRP